ncbi:hypothetical protein scyTo_0007530 [Scyliorhinus torazame]|uniref:Uncharacterized protein n=1 Tax=Scyliorhinus torazame TaxID=75743 RepID=A0A401NU39_SCYTO|nr:hypothetical protein [Scyliorhinus torazame]
MLCRLTTVCDTCFENKPIQVNTSDFVRFFLNLCCNAMARPKDYSQNLCLQFIKQTKLSKDRFLTNASHHRYKNCE